MFDSLKRFFGIKTEEEKKAETYSAGYSWAAVSLIMDQKSPDTLERYVEDQAWDDESAILKQFDLGARKAIIDFKKATVGERKTL